MPFLRGVKSLSDVTTPAVSSRGSLGHGCSEKRKESLAFLRRASMALYPYYLAGKGWLEATETGGRWVLQGASACGVSSARQRKQAWWKPGIWQQRG